MTPRFLFGRIRRITSKSRRLPQNFPKKSIDFFVSLCYTLTIK